MCTAWRARLSPRPASPLRASTFASVDRQASCDAPSSFTASAARAEAGVGILAAVVRTDEHCSILMPCREKARRVRRNAVPPHGRRRGFESQEHGHIWALPDPDAPVEEEEDRAEEEVSAVRTES
jgi:hypothetical protein